MSTRGVDMSCPISQFSISTHIRDEPAKHYVEVGTNVFKLWSI